jgi:hypothetical protein
MRYRLLATMVAAVVLPFSMTIAHAGPVERACLNSDRGGATRSVCSCIQQAADMTLRGNDQRRAAKMFNDPDEVQRVRMSDRSSDEAFWDRYKEFGQTAEAFCAG